MGKSRYEKKKVGKSVRSRFENGDNLAALHFTEPITKLVVRYSDAPTDLIRAYNITIFLESLVSMFLLHTYVPRYICDYGL